MGPQPGFGQPVAVDMGVDLGRADVGVTQQLLDHPQVGPAFQEVGGVGMAQGVGRTGRPAARQRRRPS